MSLFKKILKVAKGQILTEGSKLIVTNDNGLGAATASTIRTAVTAAATIAATSGYIKPESTEGVIVIGVGVVSALYGILKHKSAKKELIAVVDPTVPVSGVLRG